MLKIGKAVSKGKKNTRKLKVQKKTSPKKKQKPSKAKARKRKKGKRDTQNIIFPRETKQNGT